MARVIDNQGVVIPVVMDRAGSIVGVSVACTAPRSAGSATFTVFINGSTTSFGVTLDATNSNNFSAVQAAGSDTFGANGRVDVRITSTSTWSPTTTDCEAVVTVQYS